MTDTMTQTPAIVQTPSSGDAMKACSRTGCNWKFKSGTGYVPDLEQLYRAVRNTGVERSKPLARSEVFSQEFCSHCRTLAAFPAFPTINTLSLMQRWSAANSERKERYLDNRAAFLERQKARSLAFAIAREDKSPINRLFAEAKPHAPRHKKPGQRYMNSGRTKKVQAEPETPNNKKNRKKQQQAQGKKKGGR